MNIMWTPNKRRGLFGKINSGVDGVTPLSTFKQMFLLIAQHYYLVRYILRTSVFLIHISLFA